MEDLIPRPSPQNTASINEDITWLQAIDGITLLFFSTYWVPWIM